MPMRYRIGRDGAGRAGRDGAGRGGTGGTGGTGRGGAGRGFAEQDRIPEDTLFIVDVLNSKH